MKEFVRVFRSSTGDVYHIELSENHSILSQKTIGALDDISVVGVELRRLSGKNPTGHEVLSAIEGVIADFFIEHKNSIICYYCDFINPIPIRQRTRCLLRNIGVASSTGCFRDILVIME